MLSLNVDIVLNMLIDVYIDFLGISNYDVMCNFFFIGYVVKDLNWFVEV